MSDPKPMDPERLAELRPCIVARQPGLPVQHLVELLDDRDHWESEATVLRVELLAREQDIIAQDANRRGRFPSEVFDEGYQPMTEADLRAGAEQAWATTYVGPDPDATHEAGFTLDGETFLVRVKVGDKVCLQSLMHKDAAALAGWLKPARWVATAYRVEDLDRVSIKNLEGEDLARVLELVLGDVDRRLGQAEPEPVT